MPHPIRPVPSPAPTIAALAGAALLAGVLPGGRWSDSIALLASVAMLAAAHEGRPRDMLLAAGLAAGLAPVGWLLAPLAIGLAIRRGGARHLLLAGPVAAMIAATLPWPPLAAALPNLAALPGVFPKSLALVAATGVGLAAWLAARATILPPPAVLAEARLGVLLLAAVLPLPVGAIGFVVMIAALPLPAPPRPQAANDNVVHRRIVRLAA